ncbi:MAG: hypothetical protein AB1349_02565 [Elusimicrobiota bacterium]
MGWQLIIGFTWKLPIVDMRHFLFGVVLFFACSVILFQIKYKNVDIKYHFSLAVLSMMMSVPLLKGAHEVMLFIPTTVILSYYYYTDKKTFFIVSLVLILLTLSTSQEIVGRKNSEKLLIYGVESLKYVILFASNLCIIRQGVTKCCGMVPDKVSGLET